MENHLISIIIPVFNAEKYLDRCINSLLTQSYVNFELLLIDDYSTDNSKSICIKYSEIDSRITVLFNDKNRGVSFTRNKGLREAKGKYVTFIDADDWINNTYLYDFFLFPIPKNSIVSQGIFYDFKNNKKQILYTYTNQSFNFNSTDNFVVENELFHNGCPVAKLYDIHTIRDNNILFDESISLHEDHLFVLEYYKYVEHITLIAAMNYHYWFDYFEVSLTKKSHGFTELMVASQGFFDIIPILKNRYKVTDHEYLSKLYTIFGFNQMFHALIYSYNSKSTGLPFRLQFSRVVELHEFISNYYFPKEFSLKVLKHFVLNYNTSINKIFFFSLANWLYFRKRLIRLLKKIMNIFNTFFINRNYYL